MVNLAEKVLQGDRRSMARLITLVENQPEQAIPELRAIYPSTGRAQIIGITGPPGSGKSTLTDKLAKIMRQRGKLVGIIAVDPTSPFSGGAILGDRIRMQDLATDPGIFIRSMGTRGSLGGLAKATHNAIKVLDAAGMDLILVETVGVGQSEVDIIKTADTILVALVPGMGDDVQTIKAGIMEIADVFVVNKADRADADRVVAELEMMLDLNCRKTDWQPPIVKTVATANKGIGELADKVEEHLEHLAASGELQRRRKARYKAEIMSILEDALRERLLDFWQREGKLDKLLEEVTAKKRDPYSVAEEMILPFSGRRLLE